MPWRRALIFVSDAKARGFASGLRAALTDFKVDLLTPGAPVPGVSVSKLGAVDLLVVVPSTMDALASLPSPPPIVALVADLLPGGAGADDIDIWVRPLPGWEAELAARIPMFEARRAARDATGAAERSEALALRHLASGQAARALSDETSLPGAAGHAATVLCHLLDADAAVVYHECSAENYLPLLCSSPTAGPLPDLRLLTDDVDLAVPREDGWLLLEPERSTRDCRMRFALHRPAGSWTQEDLDFADDLIEGLSVALHAASLLDRLRESEARYRDVFDRVGAAVFVINQDGWIRLVNHRAEELMGYSREETEGKLKVGSFTAPEEWPRVARAREQGKEDFAQLVGTQEYDCIRADGQRRRIRAQFSLMPDATEMLATFVDVTVERDLQRQLLQAEKIASLGQLVGGVAHELNNPLSAILGSAELAQVHDLTPAVAEHLTRIVDETERCRGIIANLLTFARERRAELLPVDINAVVMRAVDLQAYALSVDNIQVDLRLARDLPYVLGDPARLEQVVVNLVLNSHQAMRGLGQGRLTVTTALRGHRVRLTLADTGPGIPPENLSRIFDPFFSTKPVGEGTGLGLSVSMGIVLDLGGDMWAQSTPGHGARFHIELPEARFQTPAPPAPQPAELPVGEIPPSPRPGVRVLLVEDEPSIRDVVECALEAEGYLVQSAPDGQDAAAMLATTDFDAILCDLRTPRLDGVHLYRHVAETKPDLAARFIILTGDVASDYTRRFLESVGVPVLKKPFSLAALRATVYDVTQRSS